ncbi:tyrosine-type recombinase/integrase [Fusobacterium nucleatum]|uniref:Site-specific recombinase, phage integrase family n=1 Tax=Fusobacterium nucleatum TaxID=851 RepID=A0A133P057_FUSNU|nr:site-specific integrase [Fusobacterium nucleatum]KXA21950.1 site-specific recombinase, phage integrase family [Fusobacterium nucleatum]MCL4592977.1 integrase [Fusobacterium nucleatum YWH7053]
MKNENGSGSVYKLKGKRKKCWIARVTIGFEEGKQKRKVIGTYETRKEAQTELLGYLNNPTLYSGKTFKDVKDLWYSNYSKTVSNVTLRNVNNQLKKLDVFNDVKIKELKLYTLQKFFDGLDGAYGSKLYLRSVLNMIFEFALKNEFIETNKIKFIELGKNEKIVERRIFTTDEINILFDSLDSDNRFIKKMSYATLILIYTGLRISELMNLKTEDVDLERNVISVVESKTSAGIRKVPISQKVIHLFKDNIDYSKEYFLYNKKGGQYNYVNFFQQFKTMLELLNLERHTIHDTRHTFATLLNNANANSTSIIKLIGHSDFKTTEEIYTHKDIEELRKAVNLLN